MFFNTSCYIVSISDKKIKVTIDNEDDLNKFKQNLIKLYNSKKSQNIINKQDINKDVFLFTINNKTKFDLKYKYTDLKDLIGIRVNISGQSKYYIFKDDSNVLDDINGTKSYKSGYNFILNKIYD
jgi:hypothetical protein